MEHPFLSILICHLIERKKTFTDLVDKLHRQITIEGSVEILDETDNGELTVGAKRNRLMRRARGEYVAFVDDDDDISDDYVSSILAAIETRPDCVGIEGTLDSDYGIAVFKHSIQFQGWYTGDDAFYRTPNHLNPIRRSIAAEYYFPDIRAGEDRAFSAAMQRRLKTEVYIGHPIYFYKKIYGKARWV